MTSDEMQVNLGYMVRWDPKFAIGIPAIDAQHRKLFMLCNNLHRSLTSTPPTTPWEEEYKFALKSCVEYVLVHFKSEETLMQAAGYAGFKEHKAVHETFVKKVLELSKAENFSLGSAYKLVRFLHEWILAHIAHEDRLFARSVIEYAKARKVSGGEEDVEKLLVQDLLELQ